MPFDKEQQAAYYQRNKERLNATRQANRVSALSPNRFENDLAKHLSKTLNSKVVSVDIPNFLGVDIPTIKQWFEIQFTDDMSWSNYKENWFIKNRYDLSDFDHPSIARSFMTNPKSFYPARIKTEFNECMIDFLWKDNIKVPVPWLSTLPKDSTHAIAEDEAHERFLRNVENWGKGEATRHLKSQGLTTEEAVSYLMQRKRELGGTLEEAMQSILSELKA